MPKSNRLRQPVDREELRVRGRVSLDLNTHTAELSPRPSARDGHSNNSKPSTSRGQQRRLAADLLR